MIKLLDLSKKVSLRTGTRRLQIALGILWLLDGALQLQPQMFTSHFANIVIARAAQGQPIIVNGPMHWAVSIILAHPAVVDSFFAVIQLVLGAGILWKRTTKLALSASVLWALGVWYFGEGLGGLLSGQTSLLVGAPGAVIIYALIALGLLTYCHSNKVGSDDTSTRNPSAWLAVVWFVVWVGGAIYRLAPGQNSTAALAATIKGGADGAPGWLAGLDTYVGNALHGHGVWVIMILAIIEGLIGLLIFWQKSRRLAVGAGIIVSILFWFVGQSLGMYFTGRATDPNSAPLMIMLGLAVLSASQSGFEKLKQSFKRATDDLLLNNA